MYRNIYASLLLQLCGRLPSARRAPDLQNEPMSERASLLLLWQTSQRQTCARLITERVSLLHVWQTCVEIRFRQCCHSASEQINSRCAKYKFVMSMIWVVSNPSFTLFMHKLCNTIRNVQKEIFRWCCDCQQADDSADVGSKLLDRRLQPRCNC